MEPVVGFEPTTDGLQNRCSTTELNWRPNSGNPQTSKKAKPFGNALRIADKAKKASAGNAKRHVERQSPVERSRRRESAHYVRGEVSADSRRPLRCQWLCARRRNRFS